MSRDEIIAMATEAGLNSYRIAPGEALAVWKRFAALVAAKERKEQPCRVEPAPAGTNAPRSPILTTHSPRMPGLFHYMEDRR